MHLTEPQPANVVLGSLSGLALITLFWCIFILFMHNVEFNTPKQATITIEDTSYEVTKIGLTYYLTDGSMLRIGKNTTFTIKYHKEEK